LQGGERESSELFNKLIRSSVREAFWQRKCPLSR